MPYYFTLQGTGGGAGAQGQKRTAVFSGEEEETAGKERETAESWTGARDNTFYTENT